MSPSCDRSCTTSTRSITTCYLAECARVARFSRSSSELPRSFFFMWRGAPEPLARRSTVLHHPRARSTGSRWSEGSSPHPPRSRSPKTSSSPIEVLGPEWYPPLRRWRRTRSCKSAHTPTTKSLRRSASAASSIRASANVRYVPGPDANGPATLPCVPRRDERGLCRRGSALWLYLGADTAKAATEPARLALAICGAAMRSASTDLGEILDSSPRPVRVVHTACFGGGFADVHLSRGRSRSRPDRSRALRRVRDRVGRRSERLRSRSRSRAPSRGTRFTSFAPSERHGPTRPAR